MAKPITVPFSFNGADIEIPLTYTIESTGTIQTISCSVLSKTNPQWLQIRKFDLVSFKENNAYIPMYNERNNEKNQASALFIDKVYENIMQAEKLKVKAEPEIVA